jgi:hypothetical protein
MLIIKCDICEKELHWGNCLKIDHPDIQGMRLALCDDCGKPVLSFLKEYDLIKQEK